MAKKGNGKDKYEHEWKKITAFHQTFTNKAVIKSEEKLILSVSNGCFFFLPSGKLKQQQQQKNVEPK